MQSTTTVKGSTIISLLLCMVCISALAQQTNLTKRNEVLSVLFADVNIVDVKNGVAIPI